MSLPKLRIQQHERNPRTARFWLDDYEITYGLRSVDVSWKLGELTVARIEIAVGGVEIDAETVANLIAVAEMRERES